MTEEHEQIIQFMDAYYNSDLHISNPNAYDVYIAARDAYDMDRNITHKWLYLAAQMIIAINTEHNHATPQTQST